MNSISKFKAVAVTSSVEALISSEEADISSEEADTSSDTEDSEATFSNIESFSWLILTQDY